MQYNKRLQDVVLEQVQQNDYAVRTPLLVFYREDKNQIVNDDDNLSCWKDWYYLDGEYENFYFGKNAWDITGAQDLSIFKGRYLNLPSLAALSGYDWTSGGTYDYLKTKSVGGSYNVLNQQIEANRGYNFFLTQSDLDDAQEQVDDKDNTACEDEKVYIS